MNAAQPIGVLHFSIKNNCLNIKELLAQNRRDMLSLGNCNRTRTYNHLLRKQKFNHCTC